MPSVTQEVSRRICFEIQACLGTNKNSGVTKNVNTPKAKLVGEISLEDIELSPEKLKENHQKINSQEKPGETLGVCCVMDAY